MNPCEDLTDVVMLGFLDEGKEARTRSVLQLLKAHNVSTLVQYVGIRKRKSFLAAVGVRRDRRLDAPWVEVWLAREEQACQRLGR